jgi:aminomethyltransferase
MPEPTPFYPRTSKLCKSMQWRYWSGYFVPSSYEVHHDVEYYAIRNSAGLIDISPMYKYDVTGKDALNLCDRIVTRDMKKCAVGQAVYSAWCDEEGKTLQDGTIFRVSENHFRFNTADPMFRWMKLNAAGLSVEIKDVSDKYAALALQGPLSRNILQNMTNGTAIDALKFFRLANVTVENIPMIISRTGYTGDLGYELWVPIEHAVKAYDMVMEAGHPYGITPAGNISLDISRIEAGFILIEIEYISSEKAIIESQKYSPYEIGLGWTVHLQKPNFVGKKKLVEDKKKGVKRQLIGLDIRWDELERVYQEEGLPPQVPSAAWRGGIPIYNEYRQIGKATSGCWSPVLKKYIALGTVETPFAEPGKTVQVEITVEYQRKKVLADIVKLPFFNPERKKA